MKNFLNTQSITLTGGGKGINARDDKLFKNTNFYDFKMTLKNV